MRGGGACEMVRIFKREKEKKNSHQVTSNRIEMWDKKEKKKKKILPSPLPALRPPAGRNRNY